LKFISRWLKVDGGDDFSDLLLAKYVREGEGPRRWVWKQDSWARGERKKGEGKRIRGKEGKRGRGEGKEAKRGRDEEGKREEGKRGRAERETGGKRKRVKVREHEQGGRRPNKK
jgi:hypothetical protein